MALKVLISGLTIDSYIHFIVLAMAFSFESFFNRTKLTPRI